MNDAILEEFERKLRKHPCPNCNNSASYLENNAAVLVPFAYHHSELVILFTHRSHTLVSHRGQVSFPGGMHEPTDPDMQSTALRETEEEIGISSKNIQIFGQLDCIQSHTGTLIFPFVGFIKDLNGLNKNLDEVERIFCIPYAWLSDPHNLHQEDYRRSNGEIQRVWSFNDYDGEKIWGITAEITRQLIEL